MIKIARITIIDTGYPTSNREGSPKAGTDRNSPGSYICNSGNAITINCPNMSLTGGTNSSAEPNPSTNQSAETSHNTFKNEQYIVPFLINVTNSTERDSLREIHALSKTIGVKLLYSSDTSTSLKMIPEILGRTDTKFHDNEVTAGIPVFVCKVIGFTINNKPSKKYAITGKLTIIEEKVFPV